MAGGCSAGQGCLAECDCLTQTKFIVIAALVFVALLLVALLVWAIWVRPYVKKAGARTASPYSLAALVQDFATSLLWSRGMLPWFLRVFAVILVMLAADLILVVLLLFFGV